MATDGTDYNLGIYTLPVSGGAPKEVAVPMLGKGSFTSPHYNHGGGKVMYSDGPNLWSVSARNGRNKQMLVRGLQDSGNWEIVNYANR